ncbi:hypothetical protein P378_06240 [Desulforamulus profundi]|uniref:Peptidase S24/S26A/S26B/S26C domain-containing protein n=1 Tax=Desulforamulus profundi TaxID=1383067 RepID=A0A2C6MGX9_9FIRM|nr:S24 family peptidase [Desulforamulus profundi]PHJ38985.1 hypothetical protein P378_06240 [Desulforamulus profundi]
MYRKRSHRIRIKFYIKKGGQIYLRSANPNYEDIEYGPNHRIIGIMVGIIRESAPSLSEYQELLRLKEYQDNRWTEVIESAVSVGFKPEHLKQLIDMQVAVANNLVKELKKTYKT